MAGPEAPENVRLVHVNGDSMGVEVYYIGRDEAGIHIWEATASANVLLKPGWRLYCAMLPPKTAIQFRMKGVS